MRRRSSATGTAGTVGATSARGGTERRTVTLFHMVDSWTDTGKEDDINILIVEDVFLVQKLTERMVLKYLDSSHKLNVSMVSDGADAVEACKETTFDAADFKKGEVHGGGATDGL